MISRNAKLAAFGAILAAPFALGACVIAVSEDGFDSHHDIDFDGDAGSVFGAGVGEDDVTFRVTSNGCTDKGFFDVDVDRLGDNRYSVTIDRRKADPCRALIRGGVEISWTFAELDIPDGADVRIGNQVRRR